MSWLLHLPPKGETGAKSRVRRPSAGMRPHSVLLVAQTGWWKRRCLREAVPGQVANNDARWKDVDVDGEYSLSSPALLHDALDIVPPAVAAGGALDHVATHLARAAAVQRDIVSIWARRPSRDSALGISLGGAYLTQARAALRFVTFAAGAFRSSGGVGEPRFCPLLGGSESESFSLPLVLGERILEDCCCEALAGASSWLCSS